MTPATAIRAGPNAFGRLRCCLDSAAVTSSDLTTGLAGIVHDVLGALGTVRLSVTAARDEPEAELRATLLDGAEQEVRRLAGLVNALPAFVGAAGEHPTGRAVRSSELAIAAAELAAQRRVHVHVDDAAGELFAGPSAPAVLAAVAVLVSGSGHDVTLGLTPSIEGVRVRVARAGGGHVRDERVTGLLIESLGGRRLTDDQAVSFLLPQQR